MQVLLLSTRVIVKGAIKVATKGITSDVKINSPKQSTQLMGKAFFTSMLQHIGRGKQSMGTAQGFINSIKQVASNKWAPSPRPRG